MCHNTKNRNCRGTGIKRITIETRPGDREVGGSGAGGSIPDLRHQKPGNDPNMSQKLTLVYTGVTLAGHNVALVYTSVPLVDTTSVH